MAIKSSPARVVIFFLVILYALSIHLGHVSYFSQQPYAPGIFYIGSFDFLDYIILFFILFVSVFFLPLKLDRPSIIFFYSVYFLVFVPAVVIALGNRLKTDFQDIWLLFSLLLSVFVISLPSKFNYINSFEKEKNIIRKDFILMSLICWLLMGFALIFKYHDIMQFSGLDEIYQQREKTADANVIWGYTQVYFPYFFSSILLAAGFSERNILLKAIGCSGFIIVYMITAERSIFLFPFLIFIFFKISCNKERFIGLIKIFLIGSFLFNCFVALFSDDLEIVGKLGFYYLIRVLAIPGQFISDYYNYFSENGYTYWSHVRGISFIVDPPEYLAHDDLWPKMGWIIGKYVHGLNTNSNASFWATDGVAAAGCVGIVVISVILALYLAVLDRLTKRWPAEFIFPAIFPLAFVISNGSLLTTLLSYGGFLWLLVLYIYRPRGAL